MTAKNVLSACLALTIGMGAIADSHGDGAAGEIRKDLRPYTLDDHLALEFIDRGAVSGTRFVWEQAAAYDQIGYYGYSHIGAWGRSGFSLNTIDLSARNVSALPLLKADVGTSYWIDSFSPDGRYLAFYAAKDGVFFMGAYDTHERHVRSFKPTPMVHWHQGRESVWISPEEFVYSAYVGDGQPLAASRPHTGGKLQQQWAAAWSGGLSVSIDDSALDRDTQRWTPGLLYRANARTGVLTLLAEGRYESLTVSATGRYLAALRLADLSHDSRVPADDWVQSHSQLMVFDLRQGGPARIVASEKNIFPETLAWAPDVDRLAFFAWDASNSKGVRSGFFHALDARTGAMTVYHHRGLDLASERERGFVQKPERVMWVDGRLAVFARKHGGNEPRFTYRDIVRSGDPDYPGKADWFLLDALGRSENLTAHFKAISPIPVHADAKTVTILADGDVWRVGPNRAPQNLTATVESELSYPRAVEYSTLHRPFLTEVILERRDDKSPGFALIDLRSGSVAQVSSPAADAEYLTGSVEAGAVLFRHVHANGADLVLKYADGRQTVVDRLNEHLAGVAKTEWAKIVYKVSSHIGERQLEGCVLRPPGYEAGKRYPVIVEVYPSRGADCTSSTSQRIYGLGRRPGPYSEHLLAAKGYVVFKPNTTREVTRTATGPFGGMTDMVLQALDALVAQGYADPDRVGLLGMSQGGFASLWVACQTNRFKAVVSLNGWADMYGHYFDTSYLHKSYTDEVTFIGAAPRYESTAGTDFSIGRTPFESPDAYVRNSPMFCAPSYTAPVLLIHSDMDAFALSQYERMFTALNLQHKRARLLRYWGEGHGPSSPANIRHMWNEIFRWYDQYVLPIATDGKAVGSAR